MEGVKKARGIPYNEKCANYQKDKVALRRPKLSQYAKLMVLVTQTPKVFSLKAKALSADCLKVPKCEILMSWIEG